MKLIIRNSECGIRNYCYRFAVDLIVCEVKCCQVKEFMFLIVQLLLILHTILIIREADTEIPNSEFRIPN